MAEFTYMGTKKSLAKTIGALCDNLGDGPFLDLFSGISAAGASVASKRQIWCNDAQVFSRTLTEALYLSSESGPRVSTVAATIQRLGNKQLNVLVGAAKVDVDRELNVLWGGSTRAQVELQSEQILAGESRRSIWEVEYGYCLFTTLYAGSYLGLVQAMQLDSIRYGADAALSQGLITGEEHRWALLAICRSIAATSNSTGHFAQYMTASVTNIGRVVGKRRRCAWSYWLSALSEMKPIGNQQWRRLNKVFHGDAVEILERINKSNMFPAIVYADPPYTNDQYSRYYHLLETALLYDYPETNGKGRYRSSRFRSSFSLAREVENSFAKMIAEAAKTGSALMVSYPTNGLLPNSLSRIPEMMAAHFNHVDKPIVIPHQHSTLGASKGPNKEDVEECIFIARNTLASVRARRADKPSGETRVKSAKFCSLFT